jgi:hypothetical protein
MRAEIARNPGTQGSYEMLMTAMASGHLEAAAAGLARSLERHELLLAEPSPACTPVLEPLREIESYKKLMDRYRMRICR